MRNTPLLSTVTIDFENNLFAHSSIFRSYSVAVVGLCKWNYPRTRTYIWLEIGMAQLRSRKRKYATFKKYTLSIDFITKIKEIYRNN